MTHVDLRNGRASSNKYSNRALKQLADGIVQSDDSEVSDELTLGPRPPPDAPEPPEPAVGVTAAGWRPRALVYMRRRSTMPIVHCLTASYYRQERPHVG